MCVSSIIWAVLLLIVIYYFRNEVKNLLNALSSKGKIRLGRYLLIDLESNKSKTFNNPLSHQKNIEYHKSFESQIVRNKEITMIHEIEESGLDYNEAILGLIYHLANTQTISEMLIIDRIIIPEQINLLLSLNSTFVPVTINDLTPFYDNWRNKSNNDSSLENFIGFLINQGLIELQQGYFKISQLGKDYLSFRIKWGLQLPL